MLVAIPRGRNVTPAARFLAFHAAALSVFVVPFDWSLVGWCAGSYVVRMFGVTAGYHRYFSHRSYQLGRAAQAAMAVLAQSSGQKGVLWWAAHHRDHHRHSDGPRDLHSPRGNNHHHCRSSCRQGLRWWEIDLTYLGLRVLAAAGVARGLRPFVIGKDRVAA